MPELIFKGKEFVFNHHLSVPFRPIVPDRDRSVGDLRLDGNLIIHGDNLYALKSLLPMYAEKVDCVFIDPPYNTGNERWSYNDNVNGPMIREWLNSNPIGIEDGLRHDKWCAMMYPRLRLLHELLSERGSIWITLDDNEVHRCRAILDEVFGPDSCVAQIAWQKRTSRENRAAMSPSIDHLICYSKSLADTWRLYRNLLEPDGDEGYSNPDSDPKGRWKSVPFTAQGFRKNQVYDITTPTGAIVRPPKGRCWGATEPEFERLKTEKRVYWPRDGEGKPRIKQYPEEAKGLVPDTLWLASEVGDTEDSKKLLLEIFADREQLDFHAPKPHQLVERVLSIATMTDSVVLDSFAGTGTTAHAVLTQNQRDGGKRRFILVEQENYSDTLTAERVRRVIRGYDFTGTHNEPLLAVNLTVAKVRRSGELDAQISRVEKDNRAKFSTIKTTIKAGVLTVYGQTEIKSRFPGTGGSFAYCTLGAALELDALLTGEALPTPVALGAVLFHTATNKAFDAARASEDNALTFLGDAGDLCVWLLYKPDLEFLKSPDAALTLTRAQDIVQRSGAKKRHLVFAAARFVSDRMLRDAKIAVEFAPLPWALYRAGQA
jgi:adenine-specific DNA-methyltransferase